MKTRLHYADAGDDGLRFILPSSPRSEIDGGLIRPEDVGHLSTIVGRGGSGKSILALQMLTALLNRADNASQFNSTVKESSQLGDPNAAFYFTLEASPTELLSQVLQFDWGTKRYGRFADDFKARVTGEDKYKSGLYLISVASPVDNANSLSLRIRQAIAQQLHQIDRLVGIVIDPMGAIGSGNDMGSDMGKLRQLSETHRTFLFLLAEKQSFESHTSLEYYSQSIIHLDHDPEQQLHRRLRVQKARGQSFRSGYHHFEIQPARRTRAVNGELYLSKGVRVFPSLQAQAAYAQELLAEHEPVGQAGTPFFSDEKNTPFLLDGEGIDRGSAVFLMGPPGTFKEYVASEFARADNQATLYVSFKADIAAVRKHNPGAILVHSRDELDQNQLQAQTYFLDARSPLLTPAEVLLTVRNMVIPFTVSSQNSKRGDKKVFSRAVIWGLRRLYDLPHFGEGQTVQFLEALVTLLKSSHVTSLLVDWPDTKTPNTVPIADLCQYIFLTRVCQQPESPDIRDKVARRALERFWTSHPSEKRRQPPKRKTGAGNVAQVALLRVQRTRKAVVHHNQGAVFRQYIGDAKTHRYSGSDSSESFAHRWLNYGVSWEEDLSLLS